MPLTKQNLTIDFSKGLDTKTDPFQISFGNFLNLENTIFQKGKLLQKRNGFPQLSSLPDTTYKYVNTFNNNLLAVGQNVTAYSSASSNWITKGTIRPIQLDTLPLVRTSSNQSQCDSVIASNGLICTVYTNSSPSTTYNYVIADSVTGQNIVAPTLISTPSEAPRIFLLGNYFIILFSQSTNLKYIAIPINNVSSPSSATTLVTNYLAGTSQLAFDGYVANNNLYIAYNATDGGGAIRMTYLNSFLVRQTAATGTSVAAGKAADMMSVTADIAAGPIIWVTWHLASTTSGYTLAVDQQLTSILAATLWINSAGLTIANVSSVGGNNVNTIVYETARTYSYGASLPTNFIDKRTVDRFGNFSPDTNVLLSVGLASKPFIINSIVYVLATYSSAYQPSYFLIDTSGSTNGSGKVVAKLAYSNGGGYLTTGLPSVTVTDSLAQIPYLIKDLIIPANKSQSPASQTPVYTQTGINLVSFDFTTDDLNSSEIGSNLFLSGGLLWAYDGYQVTEQGFNLYPDNVVVTTTTGAGSITANTYYYQALYEWTDNQGNIQRSAPSLAVQIVTTTSSSTNTIKVPTLRLTYKTLVKIVLYRWSLTQQTYYQVTSITSPTFSSVTADSVTITDTQADSAIVGNSIIYTTGGVLENIGAPATSAMSLYKSRLFLIDSEDQNLLWYSKQVIEATPVEMSDLLTVYVAPTISAQGNTGPMKALSAMDDKLIIFKQDAIYYLVGNGPDNTGTNNDFSDPVFITSTVGSANQNSIAFIPQGLMFESDKGIWLLGRDLSTQYIGAPVEQFTTGARVLSATVIPETNQVRFTMNNGITLEYDYFYAQWGTFNGISGISSTLYQSLQTFIDAEGRVFQELPGTYLDGSRPTLISLTTGWINVTGLQGLERLYDFCLLGTYLSPHKLTVQVAYDYNASPVQSTVITPINIDNIYGSDSLYGGSTPFGGSNSLEQWRIFFKRQKCQAIQITITESYDASIGQPAGAGFTLSGLNFTVGMKKTYPRLNAKIQAG